MKYLFIAEKASLMRDVMSCYNNHQDEIIKKVGYIDFIALAGHVCTVFEPNDYDDWAEKKWGDVDDPMIPAQWRIKPINDNGKKKIISQIKNSVDSYDGVIVGTDSDVEGYGIYFLLENYLGITKKKALRFIEHSLTDEEILTSLLSMTDYHTDIKHRRFVESFLLRSRADWLYGMNCTRMLSVKLQEMIATGRVKAPTIKLVYDNSMAIDNFKPQDYWNLCMNYGSFGSFLTEDKKEAKAFMKEQDVPRNVPLEGVVTKKETKRISTSAPKLYDLAAIQTEAGQHYGYTPDETLEIVQSLYEKHKLLSYPRTQCRFVSYEKSKEFRRMLKNMGAFEELNEIAQGITDEDIKRVMGDKNVVNDAEVQKESHDALLPTSTKPDLSKLSEQEKNICTMVYKRLLAQFMPKLVEDKTQVLLRHGDYDFIAKGKTVVAQGWKTLYGQSKENIIPPVKEGNQIIAKKSDIVKKTTTPPKRLNESTLLNAMINIASKIEDPELKKNLAESKGIGTPATRANIIRDIIDRGYIAKKKGGLYITETGIKYIQNIKDLDIVSPVFAAILETKIHKIQRGELEYKDVYKEMLTDLHNMCKQIDSMKSPDTQIDVICPKCNVNLKSEGYYYFCPECGTKISKKIAGTNISSGMVKQLLYKKETGFYSFKSKEGKTFRAKLVMSNGEVKFSFDSGVECPKCGNKSITINNGGAFCECGLSIFRNCVGHKLSDTEIKELVQKGKIEGISDFKSKAGKIFTANLILDEDGKTKLDFGE